MLHTFGPDKGLRLLRALDTPAETSVRANPAKGFDTALLPGAAGSVVWCPEGRYLDARPQFARIPQWHAGAFYVQDASSMIVSAVVSRLSELLDNEAPALLDLCAAPGGKTTAALAALPRRSVVVANEVMPARAAVLRENIIKWGRADVTVTSAQPARLGALGPVFDVILADVPCSGEGMMRKEEEARRQWSEGLVESCAALQRSIVADALPALRPGGFLVYSTCTFNAAEDEENVESLIADHGLEPVALPFPAEWGIEPSIRPDRPWMRFLPGFTRGEGLFMAVLRKPEEEGAPRLRRVRLPRPARNAPAGWLDPDAALTVWEEKDGLRAMSEECMTMLCRLRDAKAAILSSGIHLAETKGRDLVPAPTLAWQTALRTDAFPRVELSCEEALRYLRREAMQLPEGTPRGYLTATHGGLPLGFLKNLGTRANNLYPAEWRLRT